MSETLHAQMFGKVACLVLVQKAVATVYRLPGTRSQQIVDEDGEPVRFRQLKKGRPDALGVAIIALERTFGQRRWQLPVKTLPPPGTPVYIPLRTGRRL